MNEENVYDALYAASRRTFDPNLTALRHQVPFAVFMPVPQITSVILVDASAGAFEYVIPDGCQIMRLSAATGIVASWEFSPTYPSSGDQLDGEFVVQDGAFYYVRGKKRIYFTAQSSTKLVSIEGWQQL
jgi:hypothetical protein